MRQFFGTKSGGENEGVPKPARIPPQTPPAGGKSAEAGRIHIPSQLFRPAESILILLEKGSRKVYNYSTIEEIANFEGSPRFARRLIRIEFSGQKRIGDFLKHGSSRLFFRALWRF